MRRRREEVTNAYKPAPLGGTGMAPINNCPVSIRFHFPGTSSILCTPHFSAGLWYSAASLPEGKRRVWWDVELMTTFIMLVGCQKGRKLPQHDKTEFTYTRHTHNKTHTYNKNTSHSLKLRNIQLYVKNNYVSKE